MKPIAAILSLFMTASAALAASQQEAKSFDEFIQGAVVPRDVIDGFVHGPAWARFDPEVGYILGNSLTPWGMDGSSTIETTQADGGRTSIPYRNKATRINTYGDSFTECAQVSDGETWQTYLAAHLGEPVRNFGVGGHGVYQAYRRMVREENTDHDAGLLILMICCDDSTRSLLRARHAITYPGWDDQGGRMFHGNFWSHIEMDLETGRFVEKEQLLSTPESLYRMSDVRWMTDHLKGDLALQLYAYSQGLVRDLDRKKVARLARLLDFSFDWSVSGKTESGTDKSDRTPTLLQQEVASLLNRYGQRATLVILEKARNFARQHDKRLLVVLNFTTAFEEKAVRDDQEILDYLVKEDFAYVDINHSFRDEFLRAKTTLSFADYMKQYMVNGAGHLNPRGNHLVAYALKDKVISMLDPKPVPYQPSETRSVNFEGYLHGGGYH
jgi:hypothetical protein